MDGQKSILVVGDNRDILVAYTRILEENYNVVPVLYSECVAIPRERFDGAIIDGLNGEWEKVAEKINVVAEKINVISTVNKYVEGAIKKGFKGINRLDDLSYDKLERILE